MRRRRFGRRFRNLLTRLGRLLLNGSRFDYLRGGRSRGRIDRCVDTRRSWSRRLSRDRERSRNDWRKRRRRRRGMSIVSVRRELLVMLRVRLEGRRRKVVVTLFGRERRLETVLKRLIRIIHRNSLHVSLVHHLKVRVGLLLLLWLWLRSGGSTLRRRKLNFDGGRRRALTLTRRDLRLNRRGSGNTGGSSYSWNTVREDALLAVLAGAEREESTGNVSSDIGRREVVGRRGRFRRFIRRGRRSRFVDDSEAVNYAGRRSSEVERSA